MQWPFSTPVLISTLLFALPACSGMGGDDDDATDAGDDDSSMEESSPTPVVVLSGSLVSAGSDTQIPAEGAVYVFWLYGNGEDIYVFGRGESSGTTFSVSLSSGPPDGALWIREEYQLGYGFLGLYAAGTEISDGPLSYEDVQALYDVQLGTSEVQRVLWFPTEDALAAYGLDYGLDPAKYKVGYNCVYNDSDKTAISCGELEINLD